MDQVTFNNNASSAEDTFKARATQLWAIRGRPSGEFVRVNENWFADFRKHATRDEGYTQDPAMPHLHPRIYEIQMWTMNRLPRRPTSYAHPAILDMNIHCLWHLFTEAARRFHPDDPNQCVLAAEILYLRGLGLRHEFGTEVVPAYASNGKRVFVDLPYLYEDFRLATAREDLSRDDQSNLAAFTARLASYGVLDKKLFGLCLISFREAFEVPEATSSDVGGVAGPPKTLRMLDAVHQWLHLTRHRIEAMAEDGVVDGFDVADAKPGPLAPPGCPAGFGAARWQFWGQRLRDLSKSADSDVAEMAEGALTWYDAIDMHTLGGDEPGDEKPLAEWKSTADWISGVSS